MSLGSHIRRTPLIGASLFLALAVLLAFTPYTSAQSPAAMSVYNRAASMRGGNGGVQGSGMSISDQGINAYDNGAQAPGSGVATQQTVSRQWETIEVDSPEYIYKGHDPKEPILSTVFMEDDYGQYFVLSGSGDKTAKIWLLEGKYNQETTEWFVTSARVRKTYKDEHKQGITSAIFSPDFSYVLTSSYDGIGRIWNINNQKNIRAYLGAKDRLWKVAVTPSGEYVAGACNDGRIYLWGALTAERFDPLPNADDSTSLNADNNVGHQGAVYDVAFDPNSNFVASAGADGVVRLWNLSLLRQVAAFKGHEDQIYSVCFSEDGSRILTASRDKTARLWDPSSGEELCRFVGHTGAVRQAVFAGSYICTASDDGTIRLWTAQGKSTSNRNNSNRNASGSLGSGDMMDDPTMAGVPGRRQQSKGKPVREPGKAKGVELARFNSDSAAFSVDVSSDGVYVVGGYADGVARIWRVPGMARYYNDNLSGQSQSGSNSTNYGSGSSSLGSDPMGNSNATLPEIDAAP
ncbi:MAG: WD40 repeat domain-containing protein [Planctomycetia bacterium]|nr:WD40 repeat domain-containing protein [Planctomycetia bacterium]